jgi:hypothetical protein
LRRGVEHGVSTEGVYIYELYSGHCGAGENSACDGVWNIVKFQIQEDARAKSGNFSNGLRASGCKQLAADLEHSYEIGNLFSKFQRC